MSTLAPLVAVQNVDARIAEIARTRPNDLALLTSDEQVSFSELEAQTNRVAACLIERGVNPGDVVAVCLSSSLAIAPVLRGILRVGAILTPVDPDHPRERVDHIVADSGARVFVTTNRRPSAPHPSPIEILAIDEIPQTRYEVPPASVSLDEPACILYTSGSTGQPKGVLRLHQGINSRLSWMPCEQDDIFCHNMSLCYGFSQERLFLPLMKGVAVAILPDECHKDPLRFAQEVQRLGVTQITVVPPFLEQLIDPKYGLYEHLRGVRSVTVGSAFLSPEVIARFDQVLPHAQLVNVYGSTESGTLTRGSMSVGSEENVGSPLRDMEVFVLDEKMQPVPAGEVGELYGGGPGLAAGYWRKPDLTAERFIPNPFETTAARLYRMGDRGRFLPNGEVQLRGRTDKQVKVRGHRVELAEVEVALQKIGALKEVAVTTQPIGNDNRLVAYVCPRTQESVSVTAIRRHLRNHIPDHMLPSAYVFLAELPRTAIGKIDASALPQPGSARPDLECPYSAPQTPLEGEVADVWAEILERDCVGRDDHFIDLGGDSINAVEIAAVLGRRLGVHVDAVSCFELPTVAEMVAWIDGRLAKSESA
jgi:amino acid adenylation domain-containing protein